MTNKIIRAFSIAEVLVTMMVVALVVVMSAPVITRKKTNADARVEGGFWECILDDSGRHVSSDPAGTQADKSACIFKRPSGVKEFSILVIGGGGGGAAGSDNNFNLASHGQPVSGEVPVAASYDYLLVGGGGGGQSFPGNSGGIGANGCAGSFASGKLFLTQGLQIHLSAGSGGSGGYSSLSGDGDEDPAEGGSSSLVIVNSGTYTANGGGAGGKCSSSRVMAYAFAGTVMNFTGLNRRSAETLGSGGLGKGRGARADAGNNGVAIFKGNILTGGGGGRAGEVVYKSMKSLPEQVIVKVGYGGAGGKEKGADGEQGQPSAFGTFAVAGGGIGGKAAAKTTGDVATIDGLQGEESPMGGKLSIGSGDKNAKNDMDVNNGFVRTPSDMYGAGGSGGGFKKSDTDPDTFGKGGRGASGYVRVEWN